MRDAVERGVPIIGHCLGGQLLARALGGDGHSQPVQGNGLAAGRGRRSSRSSTSGWARPRRANSSTGTATRSTLPPRRAPAAVEPADAEPGLRGGTRAASSTRHAVPHRDDARTGDRRGRATPGAGEEVAGGAHAHGGPGVQSPDAMCRDLERRTARDEVAGLAPLRPLGARAQAVIRAGTRTSGRGVVSRGNARGARRRPIGWRRRPHRSSDRSTGADARWIGQQHQFGHAPSVRCA